jgi:hypothetical protein
MRNEPDLPREHVRAWLLILVGASSTAGLTPLPVQLFHRMVFLSNSLAQLYETQPPAELVLKQDRGPYYPQAEFELERLAIQGLVNMTDMRWTEGAERQMEASFSLSSAGLSCVRRLVAKSSWCASVHSFLIDLAAAVAHVDEGYEVSTADRDLTYSQPGIQDRAVISFRSWGERLSQRATEEIASLSPPGCEPSRQHQLRLYLKYLERLAA